MDKLVCYKEFVSPNEQNSQLGRYEWSVARLIELSKDLPVFEIPLHHLNMYYTYEKLTLRELAGHMVTTNRSDLRYPIILDEDGDIMDGRHRVMKALIEEKETILAVRFLVNPVPCRILED